LPHPSDTNAAPQCQSFSSINLAFASLQGRLAAIAECEQKQTAAGEVARGKTGDVPAKTAFDDFARTTSRAGNGAPGSSPRALVTTISGRAARAATAAANTHQELPSRNRRPGNAGFIIKGFARFLMN